MKALADGNRLAEGETLQIRRLNGRLCLHVKRAYDDRQEEASHPDETPPPDRIPRSRIPQEIINTLKAVGHRLTAMQLLAEMAQRGYEWSEASVFNWCSRMVKDGKLTKDPSASPPGYGLPSWCVVWCLSSLFRDLDIINLLWF